MTRMEKTAFLFGGIGAVAVAAAIEGSPVRQAFAQAAQLVVPMVGGAAISSVNPMPVVVGPTSNTTFGITPTTTTTATATALVVKAAQGLLYSAYATNQSGTSGFFVAYNGTTAPAQGALNATSVLGCTPLSASTGLASLSWAGSPPGIFSAGITLLVTTGTTCFVNTTGGISAYMVGNFQ